MRFIFFLSTRHLVPVIAMVHPQPGDIVAASSSDTCYSLRRVVDYECEDHARFSWHEFLPYEVAEREIVHKNLRNKPNDNARSKRAIPASFSRHLHMNFNPDARYANSLWAQ